MNMQWSHLQDPWPCFGPLVVGWVLAPGAVSRVSRTEAEVEQGHVWQEVRKHQLRLARRFVTISYSANAAETNWSSFKRVGLEEVRNVAY
jgi:hypothetical protein